MGERLLSVLNMSLTGSVVLLAVLVLRLLLRRAPKGITCLLWTVVFFRLLCPFSLESVLSLMPTGQMIRTGDAEGEPPTVHVGIPAVDQAVNPYLEQYWPVQQTPSQTGTIGPGAGSAAQQPPAQSVQQRELSFLDAAGYVWIGGTLLLVGWSVLSWLGLRRRVAQAVPLGDGVYGVDGLPSPFLLGLLRPRIYVPAGLLPPALDHVLAHERAHLARRDHLWKLLAWLAVAVHWFNPLVWLGFQLLSRDMEQACDERATRDFGLEERKAYSMALLELAAPRFAAGCPVAFGEVSTRDRVRRVLDQRRPALWLAVLAVAAVVLTALCLGLDPEEHPAALPYDPSPYESFLHALERADELRYTPELYSSQLYPAIQDTELLAQVCRLLLGPGQVPMEGQRQVEDGALMCPRLTVVEGEEQSAYLLYTSGDGGCWLAMEGEEEPEVLWVYPEGTWEQLRSIILRDQQGNGAVIPPGDEEALRRQELELRLSALTARQLDRAEPYNSGWNGREIVLLASEDRLGLQVYGYADETYGSDSAMLLRCGDWIGVLEGYDWQGVAEGRGEIRLSAGNFDNDRTWEGALIFPWGWGTGAYVEELLILEPGADGSWSHHGFVNKYTSRNAQGTDQVNRGVYGGWDASTGQFGLFDGDELLYARIWDVREYAGPDGGTMTVSGENMLRFDVQDNLILMSATFSVGPLVYLEDTQVEARLYWDGAIFLRGPYIPLGTDLVGRRAYLNNRQPTLDENYTPDAEERKIEVEKGVELVFRGQMPQGGARLYFEAIDPAAEHLFLYRSVERGKGYERIPLPLPSDVKFDAAVPVYVGSGAGSGECRFILELTCGTDAVYVSYDNFSYTGPEDLYEFIYRGEVSRQTLEEEGILQRESLWTRLSRVTAQQLEEAGDYDGSWNGQKIVRLAREPSLGLELYGYAEEDDLHSGGMLLRSAETVTPLPDCAWGYAVAGRAVPELHAGDFDADGIREGALVWLAGWGTQCEVQQLVILEPEEKGGYTAHRFPAEDWVMRDVSCTWEADSGRFRLYDGQTLLCDRTWEVAFYDEMGGKTVVPIQQAYGGELVRFAVEGDSITLQAEIGVWAGTMPVYYPDDPGYEAAVRWDGADFRRESYVPAAADPTGD